MKLNLCRLIRILYNPSTKGEEGKIGERPRVQKEKKSRQMTLVLPQYANVIMNKSVWLLSLMQSEMWSIKEKVLC